MSLDELPNDINSDYMLDEGEKAIFDFKTEYESFVKWISSCVRSASALVVDGIIVFNNYSIQYLSSFFQQRLHHRTKY